jgi:hypothetical protein
MSILEAFFTGKIQPYYNLNNHFDPAYKPISEKISAERDDWLKQKLTEEEYERFEKLESYYYEANSYWQEKTFMYSFKLGSLLMLEILTGNDDLFKGGLN